MVRARPHSPLEADQLTLYEFLYWLYGSYIYDRVPPASRPELHLRVAQCLEALYAGSPTIAGVLAEHFARGGRPLRAAAYALEAARLEASQSAWATVEHWCRLGLKWLGTVEGSEAAQGRLNLAYELAQSYYRNGDYHSATETFQQAIDQAQLAEADPYMVARLWAYLSEGEEAQGDYPSARRALRQGQACVHKHHLPPSEVTLWLSTMEGLLLSRADKNERAVSVLQQVILDGESLPTGVFSDFVRMRTYNCLGIALSCQDRYDESTVAFQKGIEVATRLGDWSGLADLRSNLGEDFVYMGHFEEAGELMREAFDNAKKANDTDAIAWAGGILGNMYRESGHPNEAIACLEEATQLLEQTGANESEPSMYADLALSYLDLAKCDVALAIARHARQWARSRSARAYWLDALGQIEMGCSSSCEQASLHFEEAIQLFDQAGSRQFGARSRRNLAQLRAKTGQKGAAIKLAEDALVSFREKNLPFEVARTEKFLRELADQV